MQYVIHGHRIPAFSEVILFMEFGSNSSSSQLFTSSHDARPSPQMLPHSLLGQLPGRLPARCTSLAVSLDNHAGSTQVVVAGKWHPPKTIVKSVLLVLGISLAQNERVFLVLGYFAAENDDDDEVMLNVLRCQLTY